MVEDITDSMTKTPESEQWYSVYMHGEFYRVQVTKSTYTVHNSFDDPVEPWRDEAIEALDLTKKWLEENGKL